LKAVILDSNGNTNNTNLAETITKALIDKNVDCKTVNLTELNLMPCYGCEGCLKQTPGKCVMKDDTAKFMTPLATTNCIIGITDVRYGGYSANYKLAADKFALMGSPYYGMKNGKLLHRKRYPDFNAYYVVGTGTDLTREETENFQLLVKRNAMNMFVDHYGSFLTDRNKPEGIVEKLIGKVIDDGR